MVLPRWHIAEERKPATIDDVLEILLRNRAIEASFLNCSLKDLEAYLGIEGMDEGAALMASHLCRGHKLILVGDYDCDGITSVAQMSLFLKDIGYPNFEVVIPSRSDGYGFPERAVREHRDAGLFVAMDCGTMDVKAVSMARSLGADCIVIDHHEVPEKGIAPATVLINPKRPSCPSIFKEFCSSGLTLLFLTRLRRAIHGPFGSPNLGGKYLALATIGTIADMVPLVEANRILARSGLTSIPKYLPVQSLIHGAGITVRDITAGHIGYYVGPRINAAGRMADPRIAFDLLMAEHPKEIDRLTHELNRLNARRQYQEDLILREIRGRLQDRELRGRTLVMADPDWPPGIIGIVASRIQQELHYGPTIVLSIDAEKGIARGSGRSVPGFDIHQALSCCDDLLVRWGGHKMAAGLTIAVERIETFADRFEAAAQAYASEVFVPRGKVDMELDLDLVSPEFLEALKQLEPHGLGNPTPTFAARRVSVKGMKPFGREQKHLRLLLEDRIGAIYWRGVQHCRFEQWKEGQQFDVVFQADWDDFRGEPVLNLKAIGDLF